MHSIAAPENDNVIASLLLLAHRISDNQAFAVLVDDVESSIQQHEES